VLRSPSVGGLLVALLLQPVTRPAAPVPVDLAWEAPSGCPDATRILGEIARLLASTEPGPHRKRVRASAQPRRTAEGGWRLQLVVRDDSGGTAKRTLASRSCTAIADATALIVAIAIDPTIQVSAAPADAAPEPAPPVPAGSRPAPSMAAELSVEKPAPTPASRTRFAAGVFGMGRQGVLPGVAAGAGFSLAGLVGRWRLDLSAGYVLPKDVYAASTPAAGARLWQWWLALAPCRVPQRRSLEFPLCAGIEGGALHGRGIGAAVAPTDGRQPWLALTASAGTVWLVGEDLGIFVSAAAVLAVLRPAFDLGSEPVHRTPVFSGRVTLGAEWRFF
jgi:hypothetical protein